MIDLGSTSWLWLGRRTSATGAGLLSLALGAGGACSTQSDSPAGGEGDATTTTSSASTQADTNGTGTGGATSSGGSTTATTATQAAAGTGGAGGATSTGESTTATTTNTSTTGGTGTGGAGGMETGGTGGVGTGGMGTSGTGGMGTGGMGTGGTGGVGTGGVGTGSTSSVGTGGTSSVGIGGANGGSCGDSITQVASGEQCDHGTDNGSAGDGCSATCQIKSGNYFDETEANNSQSTANNIDGYAGAVGQINPVGDVDWYSVNVTVAGSSITAAIDDGFGGCPDTFDSHLSLYSPSAVLLTADFTSGISPCSAIAPAKYAAAANLPVGTYALKVERNSAAIQGSYVLEVHVAAPACGDGILQAGEQCDPGSVSVAGCSTTCQLTGDFIQETEINDTPGQANLLGTHAGFLGAIKPIGDHDYFSFEVPGPNSLVFLQTSDGLGGCPADFDSVLSLYDSSGSLLVQDDDGGVDLCSAISPQRYPQAMNLPAGTYRTRVQFKGDNAAQSLYVVTISVTQPSCGDSILESGEQCDDGPANGTPGDGCSATCQALSPWEIEPNNSIATATPQWPGVFTWKGAISPVGDHDYYTFTLAGPGKVTLTTHDVDAPTTCSSDTLLHLDDHNGTELSSDDDSGPGPGKPGGGKCSRISTSSLPAGTYSTWVQTYSDGAAIPAYQLDLVVQ